MEHSVFHEFHNLVTKANATREELTLLCNDYPTTPLTWSALSRVLPPEEAKPMLREKAEALLSVDLWIDLMRLELYDPLIDRYLSLKAAVASVGQDPASGPLWACFLALFVTLHNSFLAQVTVEDEQEEQLNHMPQSGVAPLVDLVPSASSYSERHASSIGNQNINKFFTSVALGSSSAVENAMLTSPLSYTVNETEKASINHAQLKNLTAAGDLNMTTYCRYLKRLCMIPVAEVNPKNMKQMLLTLMPSAVVEPSASTLQRANVDIEALYPKSLFTRPASRVVPALEQVSVPGWTRILQMELSDWLHLKQTDVAGYEERVSYFFSIALRQCEHVPDIHFLKAQSLFAQGKQEMGIQVLLDLPQAAERPEVAFVVSDAYEYLLLDPDKAISHLCTALSKRLVPGSIQACLCYHIVLKRIRLAGVSSAVSVITSLLNDLTMRPIVSAELCAALVELCAALRVPDNQIRELLALMLELNPTSPELWGLKFTSQFVQPPDYLAAYESNAGSGELSRRLLEMACTHVYFLSPTRSEVVRLFSLIRKTNGDMLMTPGGSVEYADYIEFVTKLPGQPAAAASRKEAEQPALTAAAIKGIIELGRKLDTLIDVARRLREHSQRLSSGGAFKATMVLQTLQKAVEENRQLLTGKQMEELQVLLADELCLQSLKVWLNE